MSGSPFMSMDAAMAMPFDELRGVLRHGDSARALGAVGGPSGVGTKTMTTTTTTTALRRSRTLMRDD